VGASLRRSPLGRWRGLDGFGRRLSTLFLLQRRQRDRRNARCRLYGHVWRGLRSGGTLGHRAAALWPLPSRERLVEACPAANSFRRLASESDS
jgi:hypothetical protein